MVKLKSLKKLLLRSLKFDRGSDKVSLYLHFPFCKKKCSYCDFNSVSLKEDFEKILDNYIKIMVDEFFNLYSFLSESTVSTLYSGGGTPSYAGYRAVSKVLESVKSYLNFSELREATFEANPDNVDASIAEGFKEAGFNRISIGAQSFSDEELKTLGRIHNASDIENAIANAKKAGFDNLNLDLIYGIPGQTVSSFKDSLEKALSYKPEGISCYSLTLSSGNLFYESYKRGELKLLDEGVLEEMYRLACEMLKAHGYSHYEVSNWAKPGFECQHNIRYWRREPYISLGAGASSFLPPLRFRNEDFPINYALKESSVELKYSIDLVEGESEALEKLYLFLRTRDGISIEDLFDFQEKYWPSIFDIARSLEIMGYLCFEGKNLCATEEGWFKLDRIVIELTSGARAKV